jgi:hypothetical protein
MHDRIGSGSGGGPHPGSSGIASCGVDDAYSGGITSSGGIHSGGIASSIAGHLGSGGITSLSL